MWSSDDLQQIRLTELRTVVAHFGDRHRVLEIGAGAGWQSKYLAEHGFDVTAIEYAHPGFTALRRHRVWPVNDYDGHSIPFPDNSFDVVFSSNTLEHIPHVRVFQHEIRRVLKSDGIAVHLMPTASWRFWSTLTHYVFVGQRLISRVKKTKQYSIDTEQAASPNPNPSTTQSKSMTAKLLWLLVPERHGEEGNFASEHMHFSRWKWRRVFRHANFHIEAEGSNKIFYTGYGALAGTLPILLRKRLSYLLGGSCRYWILSIKGEKSNA